MLSEPEGSPRISSSGVMAAPGVLAMYPGSKPGTADSGGRRAADNSVGGSAMADLFASVKKSKAAGRREGSVFLYDMLHLRVHLFALHSAA